MQNSGRYHEIRGNVRIWDEPTEAVYTDEYEERDVAGIPPEDAIGRWWVVVDYHN